jgi:hypothetical protein
MDLLLLLAALVAIGIRVYNDPPPPLVTLPPDADAALLRAVDQLTVLDLWASIESARITTEAERGWSQ